MNKTYSSRIINLIGPLDDFTDFVQLHLDNVPGTRELEKFASDLIDSSIPEEMLIEFVEKVHYWGGTLRQLNKVLRNITSHLTVLV